MIMLINELVNTPTVPREYSTDLHRDTSINLVEEKLDEEELLDCGDNKRKILSMFFDYYK